MFLEAIGQSLRKYEKSPAFVINNVSFSYGELGRRVAAIHNAISTATGDQKTAKTWGVAIDDNIDTYAAIIAVWASGHTFTPVNLTFPKERLRDALTQAKVDAIILTDNSQIETCRALGVSYLSTDTFIPIENWPLDNCRLPEVLYILFTSGSTGRPKGVPISSGSFESFLSAMNLLDYWPNSSDKVLQMFDLTFDVSIASFVLPLLAGSTIYTVSSDGHKYRNIARLLTKSGLTYATLVPSVLSSLRQYFSDIRLPEMRLCIVTAEAAHCDVLTEWRNCVPNARLVNLYGPTEATIWCTYYEPTLPELKGYNNLLAIGKPFPNCDAIIVDDLENKCSFGEKGELLISGSQLTDGYLLAQPKKAFVVRDGVRFYRTGDLCFLDEKGIIHYCGRIDHQIQLQGYRVELAEIEIAFEKAFGSKAVVVAIGSDGNNADAICVVGNDPLLSTEQVRKGLKEQLPFYMIPALYMHIDEYPLTASSKIDRIELKRLAETRFEEQRSR